MDFSLPGSSVHGIFQVRILEWVAISFSRGIHIHTDSTAFHVHVHTHKHIPTHDTQACQLYTDAFYPQTDINTEIHYTNIYIYTLSTDSNPRRSYIHKYRHTVYMHIVQTKTQKDINMCTFV